MSYDVVRFHRCRIMRLLPLLGLALLLVACQIPPRLTVVATAIPTPVDRRVYDPLVPTVLPAPSPVAATPTPTPAATAIISATTVLTPAATLTPTMPTEALAIRPPLQQGSARSRLGVGVPLNVTDFTFNEALAAQLGMGWYLDWHINQRPITAGGLQYAQLYAMRNRNIPLLRDPIARVAAARPGSLWLAGNEPDVIWQDNQTPETYARLYHDFYVLVKQLDPTAQVAIAGVSQVTPLRLQYLERVLAAYQQMYGKPMPVDVWNVHAFVLREERDSWGVSIPPGFDVDKGMLWEIEDHASLELFQQQVVDFRRWMAKQGQREKPLVVSEFGILMPAEYGFSPDVVSRFMTQTFDYLLNAIDPEIGYSADDNRLVQRFVWYSLSDTVYPVGNLVDAKTGHLTSVGETFARYAASLETSP
ncbi:MAG: hypothetical protein ABTQ73_04650 [Caldilineales bacterium]